MCHSFDHFTTPKRSPPPKSRAPRLKRLAGLGVGALLGKSFCFILPSKPLGVSAPLGGEELPLDRRRRNVGVLEPSSRRFWPSFIMSSRVMGLPFGHLGPNSSKSFLRAPGRRGFDAGLCCISPPKLRFGVCVGVWVGWVAVGRGGLRSAALGKAGDFIASGGSGL
mmetsp:Transcript_72310/g.114630  ORF Transcript_72310/g.114630 Transcript_72310/m.114630 type:complete len:166 (-) Transcript_72310:331-828(-)